GRHLRGLDCEGPTRARARGSSVESPAHGAAEKPRVADESVRPTRTGRGHAAWPAVSGRLDPRRRAGCTARRAAPPVSPRLSGRHPQGDETGPYLRGARPQPGRVARILRDLPTRARALGPAFGPGVPVGALRVHDEPRLRGVDVVVRALRRP